MTIYLLLIPIALLIVLFFRGLVWLGDRLVGLCDDQDDFRDPEDRL